MYCITIDSGTTNTRAQVWQDSHVLAEAFVEAGVRDTAITGSRHKLQQGVREAISRAAAAAGLQDSDISALIASGMITSNLGLHEVPHVEAPAGLKDLAAGMVSAVISEVAAKPIWFVPGVKNSLSGMAVAGYEAMDIMRGEEAEIVGILATLRLKGRVLFVLPGSHTKMASVDSEGRITGCVTTLAGELLEVITRQTILANSLDHAFASGLSETMLLAGAEQAGEVGLGRTCFTVRILDLFGGRPVNDRANFLLGAVLGTDVLAMKNSAALTVEPDMPVIIAGKKLLKEALAVLIRNDGFFRGEILMLDDSQYKDSAGFGALAIAKARGVIR